MIEIDTLWPPPYVIRRSARARQITLKITPLEGLEVVIPEFRKRFNVEQILLDKRTWIEKTLKKFDVLNKRPFSLEAITENHLHALPSVIECPAISKTWHIIYQPVPLAKKITLTERINSDTASLLILKGKTEDKLACKKILKKWLMKQALVHFTPWLNHLSTLTSLSFNQIRIRGQTTLWGSCNSKKTICLNYKLLFLPKPVVQHVLLHELCHTRYLNHSDRFWQLLQKLDTHFLENKRALKLAEHYVPRWLGSTYFTSGLVKESKD